MYTRKSKCIRERTGKEAQEQWRSERLRRRGRSVNKRQKDAVLACLEEESAGCLHGDIM